MEIASFLVWRARAASTTSSAAIGCAIAESCGRRHAHALCARLWWNCRVDLPTPRRARTVALDAMCPLTIAGAGREAPAVGRRSCFGVVHAFGDDHRGLHHHFRGLPSASAQEMIFGRPSPLPSAPTWRFYAAAQLDR